MDRTSGISRHCGLTLFELLIAIAVLAVSLSTVVPGFADLAHSIRLTRAAAQLVAALNLARSEAILRRSPVSLCPRIADDREPPGCGGDYRAGWLVIRDAAVEEGTAAELLRVFPGPPADYRLSNRAGTRVPDEWLTFYSDGSSRRSLGFLFCPPAGSPVEPLAVVVNNVGRPRLERGGGVCPEGTP